MGPVAAAVLGVVVLPLVAQFGAQRRRDAALR